MTFSQTSLHILFQIVFGKEADKLEQANDDDRTCILSILKSNNNFYLIVQSCNNNSENP